MVHTRSQAKLLYNQPVVGYSYGKLDDGTEVLVEIITKRGETLIYQYNSGIYYQCKNFRVGSIKPIKYGSKAMRFSSATIEIVNQDIPATSKHRVVFGENDGPIFYFDRKH
jgi:hypothetical protein